MFVSSETVIHKIELGTEKRNEKWSELRMKKEIDENEIEPEKRTNENESFHF